jgi:hypothetical protein
MKHLQVYKNVDLKQGRINFISKSRSLARANKQNFHDVHFFKVSILSPLSPCSLSYEKSKSFSHGKSLHIPQLGKLRLMQHRATAHSPQNGLPSTFKHPGQSVFETHSQLSHCNPHLD